MMTRAGSRKAVLTGILALLGAGAASAADPVTKNAGTAPAKPAAPSAGAAVPRPAASPSPDPSASPTATTAPAAAPTSTKPAFGTLLRPKASDLAAETQAKGTRFVPAPGIKFANPRKIEIRQEMKEFEPVLLGILRGSVDPKVSGRWTFNAAPIAIKPNGRFEIKVPLTDRFTSADLILIDKDGSIQVDRYRIDFPGYGNHPVTLEKNKRFFITPSVGVSSVSYAQTGLSSISLIAITTKLGATYAFRRSAFDLAGNVFINALAISSNAPAGTSPRFLGLNARLGYLVGFVKRPWSLRLAGGVYYTSMLGTNSQYGYSNQAGPQLFPLLRYEMNDRSSISTYFKFSPVTSGLSLLSLSNRELALGVAYSRPTGKRWPRKIPLWSASLDYSNLALSVGAVSVSASTISASFGVGIAP